MAFFHQFPAVGFLGGRILRGLLERMGPLKDLTARLKAQNFGLESTKLWPFFTDS